MVKTVSGVKNPFHEHFKVSAAFVNADLPGDLIKIGAMLAEANESPILFD